MCGRRPWNKRLKIVRRTQNHAEGGGTKGLSWGQTRGDHHQNAPQAQDAEVTSHRGKKKGKKGAAPKERKVPAKVKVAEHATRKA